MRTAIITGALFLAVFFFASYRLTESPPTWYDEGIYVQMAENMAQGAGEHIQVAPDEYVSGAFVTGGYPFLAPISWSLRIFGSGLWQARAVMVLFIMLLAVLQFVLMRGLFGTASALVSLALVGSFPLLYGDGKNVLGEVPGLVYLSISLLSLHSLEKNDGKDAQNERPGKRLWKWALLGLSAGLCAASKPIFVLFIAALFLALFIRRKAMDIGWKGVLAGGIALAAPIGLWLKLQFGQSDSASQVLGYYANPYGYSDIWHTILTNALRFFHEATPVYFLAIILIWGVSYGIRLKKGQRISAVEMTAFAFSILVALAYTRTAGWYRYLFVAMIPMLAFLPHSIMTIAAQAKERWPGMKRVLGCAGYIAIGLFMAVQIYQLLFSSWVAVHYSSTVSRDLSSYFSSAGAGQSSYFVYNVPETVIFLQTRDYYQYFTPTDSIRIGADQLPLLQKGIPDKLVMGAVQWTMLQEQFPLYATSTVIDGDYVIASRIRP